MLTELHWVDAPWPGRLALAARPRGGDWLEDEIQSWQRAGVDTVVSLLTMEEEQALELEDEARQVRKRGMDFAAFPIPDRQVPASESEMATALERLEGELAAGKNVVLHCRQGIGRTGLVAACLLVNRGWDPTTAVDHLTVARGIPVPETIEQRQWIDRYAALAVSK